MYGRGGSGIVLLMKTFAAGCAALVVDGGKNCTSVVHVDDAAKLYLLAAEAGDAAAGQCFNGVSDTTVTFSKLMGEVGALLDIPVQHLTLEEAGAQMGPFLADFIHAACRGSSDKAKRVLGWQPKEMGMLEDLRSGSYVPVAADIKKSAGKA